MSEGRGTGVFVALLLGQLVLLSSQVREADGGATKLEKGAVATVAPVAHGVTGVLDGVSWVGERLRSRSDLREENELLRQRVQELEMQNARRLDLEDQVDRLSDALGYRAPYDGEYRVADVVYIDHASWLRTLLIHDSGRVAAENSPVTSPTGVVGRVILRQGEYAKVQLVTDRASGVGAMIERTRRQGVARGAGEWLTLEYLPLQSDVQVGDRVVTSGTDGLYPRGLPLGVVVEVEPGGELFHSIRVVPAVDFGVLDQVFVLELDSVPGGLRGTTGAGRP